MRRLTWIFLLLAALGLGCSTDGSPGDDDDDTAGADAGPTGTADADRSAPTPDARPQVTGLDIQQLDRYVVLGDSLSVYTFPDLLFADLQGAFPGIERVHRAEGGSTIEDVLDQQIPGLQPHSGPVLVTLTIGGNDFKKNPSSVMSASLSQSAADAFEAELDDAIARLEGKFTGDLWILVANIHDPSDDEGRVYDRSGLDGDVCDLLFLVEDLGKSSITLANMAYWNGKHAAVTDGHDDAYLANLHTIYLGHALNAAESTIAHYHADDPTRWMIDDCAHPNARGDEEIANMFWEMIQ